MLGDVAFVMLVGSRPIIEQANGVKVGGEHIARLGNSRAIISGRADKANMLRLYHLQCYTVSKRYWKFSILEADFH